MNFKTHFIKEWTLQSLRDFFIFNNFHEVETPTLLDKSTIEPNLYPLKTHWLHKNLDFYLPTSPESSLKKLISKGIGNCFTISKVFRDLEDIGPIHNLEFSMLEWYEMDKNYLDIANTTQKLILSIYHSLLKKQNKSITNTLTYQNQKINLSSPWYFFTLKELFKKFANMDLSKNLTTKEIITTAKSKGYNTDNITTWEPLYTQIFINEIESKLPQDKPVFILDYPTKLSPLCLPCPNDPGFSQRFEFYIGGMEIGNAYTELNDSKTLKNNFETETNFRKENNLPVYPYDQEFIDACSKLPPCAGIGLGVDRLAMLFANTTQIKNVIYFPTSKISQNK
jgi:elongation factor P--beta-lysine ligase